MPSYIVRDPNTGKRYRVRQGGQPSSPQPTEPPISDVGFEATEREIANRPSAIAEVVPTMQNRYQEDLQASGGNPFMTAIRSVTQIPRRLPEDIMSGMGVTSELIRGAIANPMLAFQQDRDKDIPKDLVSLIQGKRPAQLGDVMRSAGEPGTPGGQFLSSPIMRFLANNVDLLMGARSVNPRVIEDTAQVIGQAGQKVQQGVSKGLGNVGQSAKDIGNFLIGNPRGINEAERGVNKAGQELVRSIRPDGTLSDTFWKGLKANSEKAWRPMKEVIKAIKEPFTLDELDAIAQKKFGYDPARLSNAQELIKIASNQPKPPRLFDYKGNIIEFPKGSWTAQELDELSSGFGEGMRKTAKTGTQSRDAADQLLADARSIIADAIEAKAPENMKGMVLKAKSQWSSHATDRDTAFRLFRPSAPKEAFTKSGTSALRKVSTGQPGVEDEADFFNRFQQNYGIDATGQMKPSADALRKQQRIGLAGKATTGVGALGGVSGLLRLLGLIGKDE